MGVSVSPRLRIAIRHPYFLAVIAGVVGAALICWVLVAGQDAPPFALLAAAAVAPMAVLGVVWGRLGSAFPLKPLLIGAVVGPLVAILTYPVVAAFAFAFLYSFAESGRHLVESLRADPRLVSVLASPWVILLLIEVVSVAPLTEEFGKALGAAWARPRTRHEAFLFGVAAGVGFAIVENVLYATAAAIGGGPWPALAVARSMGAAVHPLATGLVMLGWWEWREGRGGGALLKGYLSGVGIHALWNGTLVVVGVVEAIVASNSGAPTYAPIALSFTAVLGGVLAATLWFVADAVASDHDPFERFAFAQAQPIAIWTLVSAALLVPVAVLVVVFPEFYHG
jgi:RsiW-degrading membrane proteinase PrsW (M82 family)